MKPCFLHDNIYKKDADLAHRIISKYFKMEEDVPEYREDPSSHGMETVTLVVKRCLIIDIIKQMPRPMQRRLSPSS